jgi:hypothetical protein
MRGTENRPPRICRHLDLPGRIAALVCFIVQHDQVTFRELAEP